MEAEVLGQSHCGLGVADAVDVGQREPGVVERFEHHGHFERTPGALELTRRGDVVGDAHDGRGAPQSVRLAPVDRYPAASVAAASVPSLKAQAFFGNSENGVTRSLLGSLGRPSTRSPMMLRWIWSVPP